MGPILFFKVTAWFTTLLRLYCRHLNHYHPYHSHDQHFSGMLSLTKPQFLIVVLASRLDSLLTSLSVRPYYRSFEFACFL